MTRIDGPGRFPTNLYWAYSKVRKSKGKRPPGIDGQTIKDFEDQLELNLAWLHHALLSGNFWPWPLSRQWRPKLGSFGHRPLGIPVLRDRVVQTAIYQVMEPLFDPEFAPQSYGFRPGLGPRDGLRRVIALLKAGHTYLVDADIQACFDSIPHEPLLDLVESRYGIGSSFGYSGFFGKCSRIERGNYHAPVLRSTGAGAFDRYRSFYAGWKGHHRFSEQAGPRAP